MLLDVTEKCYLMLVHNRPEASATVSCREQCHHEAMDYDDEIQCQDPRHVDQAITDRKLKAAKK